MKTNGWKRNAIRRLAMAVSMIMLILPAAWAEQDDAGKDEEVREQVETRSPETPAPEETKETGPEKTRAAEAETPTTEHVTPVPQKETEIPAPIAAETPQVTSQAVHPHESGNPQEVETRKPENTSVPAAPTLEQILSEDCPQVRVESNCEGIEMHIGDELVMRAVLTGTDRLVCTLNWQVLKDGQWQDIPGETGETCRVILTEEEAECSWRVRVSVQGVK